MAGRISGALPYVEAVSINRDLPDTLQIHIQECVCSIALEQEGTTWILCSSGKVADEIAGGVPEDCTAVIGLTIMSPQVGAVITADEDGALARRQMLELVGQLRNKGMLGDVQEIHLEDSSCITLRYLDRLNVEIPWDADFDYKLNFLAAVAAKLEPYETGTLRMMTDGEARLIAG